MCHEKKSITQGEEKSEEKNRFEAAPRRIQKREQEKEAQQIMSSILF